MQCWGSVTSWCGSADPYFWLTDPHPAPDPDPGPTPDPTPFFSDFKYAKKNFFLLTYLHAPYLHYIPKIILLLNFCVKISFCKHYFSPLNIFMRKGKDPDPYLWLKDPDPNPGAKNMRIRIHIRILIPNTFASTQEPQESCEKCRCKKGKMSDGDFQGNC